ncbi:unnamed protein product [Arctogadus glacialis]
MDQTLGEGALPYGRGRSGETQMGTPGKLGGPFDAAKGASPSSTTTTSTTSTEERYMVSEAGPVVLPWPSLLYVHPGSRLTNGAHE